MIETLIFNLHILYEKKINHFIHWIRCIVIFIFIMELRFPILYCKGGQYIGAAKMENYRNFLWLGFEAPLTRGEWKRPMCPSKEFTCESMNI